MNDLTNFQRAYLDALKRDDGATALQLLMTEIERVVSQLTGASHDVLILAQKDVTETVAQMRAVLARAQQKIATGGSLTLNEAAMIGVIGVQLGRVETFACAAAMPPTRPH